MGNASSSLSRSSEEAPHQTDGQQPGNSQPQPVVSTEDADISTIPYKKEPRLTAWVCLVATSIVAMTACLIHLTGKWGPATWVFTVTIISLAISTLALAGYAFLAHKFIGKIWGEGIPSYLLLVVWSGGLAVVMSPSRGLAVTKTDVGFTVVKNANLYFSSWASFACVLYICGSWTMNYWKKMADIIKSITARLGTHNTRKHTYQRVCLWISSICCFPLAKWWCLFVVSTIVLVASAQFHYSENCNEEGKSNLRVEACKNNKYAVGLGAWACLVTLVVIILAQVGFFRLYVEICFAVLLFIMYAAGVGVITYNEGSGVTIGNLVSVT